MYIIIVGCGRVGAELARLLADEGYDTVIVDKKASAFNRLGGGFNGLTIVGNGFDTDTLKAAGINKADVFCALTNGDNTNLVCAQIAKKVFSIPKVFARVYDPQRAEIYQALGLDIISGTTLLAAMLRDKIVESRFSGYLIESRDVGVIQIEVSDELANSKVKNINIEGELQVAAIRKTTGTIIPSADTRLEKKDLILAIVKRDSLEKIRKKFKLT